MGVFDNMTLDLTGAGTVDLLTSLRTIYTDSTYEIYDRVYVNADVVVLAGFTVNLVTDDYEVVVFVNYGHRDVTTAAPTRVAVSVELTWDSGAGTSGVIACDDAGGTVESGQAIPPTILTWNGTTKTVDETFLGKDVAFVHSSMWPFNPNQGGTTDRFAVRFDPSREDTSYGRLMRGTVYGGSWLNSDGTRVRADTLQFHTSDGGSWYQAGPGFWMQTNRPSTTVNWRFQADAAHADAGYLPFCQAYYYGGEAVWTNTAYRFAIKQMAARYLGHFADPNAAYANKYFNDYQNNAMRGQGRPISSGVWIWRALFRMNDYSSGDTEVNDLQVALADRVLRIFNHIWSYSRSGGIYGFWQRNQKGEGKHPDRACASQQDIIGLKNWMGGLLWIGLYHLWKALRDLNLTALTEYTRVRELMDFVALGDATYPDGIFDAMVKWKNSHPFEAPSPLPPAWACAPSWPEPILYTIGGYGWAWEYRRTVGNTNNDDLRYLSFPSTATTGDMISFFEFLKREEMITDATQLTNLNEIISDYRQKNYTFHLGDNPLYDVTTESNSMAETSVNSQSFDVAFFIDVTDDANSMAEVVVSPLTAGNLIDITDETMEPGAGGLGDEFDDIVVSSQAMVSHTNLANEVGETSSFSGGSAAAFVDVTDEELRPDDTEVDFEFVSVQTTVVRNANATVTGTATSVKTAKTGTGTSQGSAKTGAGTSVLTTLTGGS